MAQGDQRLLKMQFHGTILRWDYLSPAPRVFPPAKVIEIFKIRSFVDQFPIQFAICAGVSAGEVKPLISDKRLSWGKRENLRLIRKLRCVTVNSGRHISYSKEPEKSARRNHQGNCCLHKFGEKLQMLWLKLTSLPLTRSLVVSKIRWFKKVKYANTTTRDTRVQPWESSEIITRKITNVFVPSCSERWSNFLEMYNLWIKTLLNNWYITSFRFSSENDRTSKIPETWLRSLAFSSLIFLWFLWCRADNFSSKNYWLRLKDAPIHLLSHPCQLSYLRSIDSPAAKWKDRSWSSF